MFENAKSKVKKIVAALLASTAVIIPSAKFIQKRLEAPDTNRDKEEEVNNSEDKSYEEIFEDLNIDQESINKIETELEETKGETETQIETEAEESKVETETQIETEAEESKVETETQIENQVVETRNQYLEDILETKGFEESMKQEIRETYNMIEKNYDSVFAYKKISKEEYLKNFCDSIDKYLNIAELVEEQDGSMDYAIMLARKGAIGLTDGDKIYLKVDELDRVEANLAHEVEHLNNQGLQVLIGNEGIDIGVTIREGMSARAEDFCEPLPLYERVVSRVGDNKSIAMDKEVIRRSDPEKDGYGAVYQTYENVVERLETLLGMDKLAQMVHTEGDFVLKLREELTQEFGQEKADRFVTNFVLSTTFVNVQGIDEMSQLAARCNLIQTNINVNENLLEYSEGKLYTYLEKEIKSLQRQIDVDTEEYVKVQGDESLSRAEKQETLDFLNGYIKSYTSKVEAKKVALENFDYEEKLEQLSFELKLDKAKLDAFNAHIEKGDVVIWDVFVELESSFNDLMTERITKADKAEIGELKAACVNYYENVMLLCYDGDKVVTRENFEQTVVKELQEKELEQGDKEIGTSRIELASQDR